MATCRKGKTCRNGNGEQSKIKQQDQITQKHTFQITWMSQHKTDLFRTCGQHVHGKKPLQKPLWGKKKRKKKQTHPRKVLPWGKIQNTRQSAASVHSSWTLLQVANVGTHQFIQQMSSNTHKEHVGKKTMIYNIPYIDKCAGNKTIALPEFRCSCSKMTTVLTAAS